MADAGGRDDRGAAAGGLRGQFGPELRRFVLMQHHQGPVTVERLVTLLQAIGVSISKRQVMRLLIGQQDDFLTETREVLRAGLQTADWISVDPRKSRATSLAPARHCGANAVCTQIGNDAFAWFGTTNSKSRLSFLDLLRAVTPTLRSTTRPWAICVSMPWPERLFIDWPRTSSGGLPTRLLGWAILSSSA